ncbi:hypothetical protein ZIOFF_047935 [Zingiber officinale]|uniref:Uncharacterized protein n=1 Tax=Zingiber officinale TaxID=94328 RepID=A0A8J5KX72_ZINOF|nr:hypothetical protein ZIOFF_047935 [Zingiber officinale]
MCCTGLKRLRLSGIRDVNGEAANALARHCPRLSEIAFLDCGMIDEAALVNVVSLRFLSIASSRNIHWATASLSWSSLPNLVGLDVSRTDVSASAVLRLPSVTKNLQALCALNCSAVDEEGRRNPSTFINTKEKLLLTQFTDVLGGIASFFKQPIMNERTMFVQWRNFKNKDKNLNDIMIWLEWILLHSLLRIAESNPHGMDDFWLRQGALMLLRLAKSSQEDVQERAATVLATFVVTKNENAAVEPTRAEAVVQNGGIPLLLELAGSCREALQSESAKVIANLSVNSKIAKAVADEGGIGILPNLARSSNRLVAEEVARGIWILSVGEEHKAAIAEAGGVKALVDLIFKWQPGATQVLERAAGALGNLAADDKCNMEIVVAGGVCALVTLAARALANLAAHGDSDSNNAAVGQESGVLEALVRLTYSQIEGVRREAAGGLWNLSFDDRNLEAIALAGGVEALVYLF